MDPLSTSAVTAAPTTAPPVPVARKRQDEIVIIGLNAGGTLEADALQQSQDAAVHPILNAPKQDTITISVNGQPLECDLRTEAGLNAFLKSLQLPPEQTEAIAAVFREAAAKNRPIGVAAGDMAQSEHGILDELAQLVQIWAEAERGGEIPGRFVLSGHGSGDDGLWGEKNGRLSFALLAKLAAAMPAAAAQIEDVHLSACNSGGMETVERFTGMFPNLKTLWAYEGSAPSSGNGATDHQERWVAATNGDRMDMKRTAARGLHKGEFVVVWTQETGYQAKGQSAAWKAVDDDLKARSAVFEAHFNGTATVRDSHAGPLREYYQAVQDALRHPDIPDDAKQLLKLRRNQALRLLYYSEDIAPKFAQTHAAAIQRGYAVMGMTPPDFATLSRADALKAIDAFVAAVKEKQPPPEEAVGLALLLTNGLKDLNAGYVPEEWID